MNNIARPVITLDLETYNLLYASKDAEVQVTSAKNVVAIDIQTMIRKMELDGCTPATIFSILRNYIKTNLIAKEKNAATTPTNPI